MPASSRGRAGSPGRITGRWLFLVHRWIGIVSCLLFAMWFLSGLVMAYVPYPLLPPAAALAGAAPIDARQLDVPPPLDHGRMPRRLSLEMREQAPVWRVERWDGTRATVAATRGTVLAPVDATMAARVAQGFARTPVAATDRITRDQWTVAGGFDRHRPLWRVRLADAEATTLYVSSETGTVVQRTTRRARFWNWLGSVPHWLYPTVLRSDAAAWRQVVLWVSGPCIAAALTGIWIGVLRTRVGRRRYKGGRVSPYRGWMLWHHLAGMSGGLFLLGWIFSGWLSVDPGRWFASPPIAEAALRAYSGGPLPPTDPARLAMLAQGARRVELRADAGLARLVRWRADGRREVFDLASLRAARADPRRIVAAARALVPGGRIAAVERLRAPDAYWYEPAGTPLLPVLRLRFDDPAATWLHLDPATGELLGRIDRRGRLYRWLYDLLHKWDLPVLTRHRPAWDLLLWTLSALGLVTAISGVRIAWRRLRQA